MRKHIEDPEGRLHSIQYACGYLNMSRDSVMKLAREAGALYEFGRLKKVDIAAIDKYVDRVCKVTD